MKTCPHCECRISPLRVAVMVREYRCGRCGGRARLVERQTRRLALVGVAVALGFAMGMDADGPLWLSLIVVTALSGLLTTGAVWWFGNWEKTGTHRDLF